MATKPAFMFKGKESKKEEAAEKKMGKKAYMAGEKREGAMSTSKTTKSYKCGGKVS